MLGLEVKIMNDLKINKTNVLGLDQKAAKM